MEDYHILTKSEVSEIYKKRVKFFEHLADTFIAKKWGTLDKAPRSIRQKLLQLLASVDKYNGTPTADTFLNTAYWLKLPDIEMADTIDYNIRKLKEYDDTLSQTMSLGKDIRSKEHPSYPALFKDNDRVYIRLPVIKGHPAQIEEMLHDFNECLPSDQKLTYRALKVLDTSYYISINKNEQSIGSFLEKKVQHLENLSTALGNKSNLEQKILAHLICQNDFYQYSEKEGHPMKVDWLKRDYHIALDPILYAYLKHHLLHSKEPISNIAFSLKNKLLKLKKSIAFEQDRQGSGEYDALEHDTDLVILSKDPHDIAWCAAYTDYEMFSCMRPDGELHYFVSEDIGRGTLVAYMVNSKEPLKRYSRILLKPYLNSKGQRIYHIGKTHGEKNYRFHQFLTQFAGEHLNSRQSDTYRIDSHLYPDSEPEQIVYSYLSSKTR